MVELPLGREVLQTDKQSDSAVDSVHCDGCDVLTSGVPHPKKVRKKNGAAVRRR